MEKLEINLIKIRNILEKVLKPTKNSPYISSEEIDKNDLRIKKALILLNDNIEELNKNMNAL